MTRRRTLRAAHVLALLSAVSLLVPAAAGAEDSATLLTEAAGSFHLVDQAIDTAATGSAIADPATAEPAIADDPLKSDEVELAALYYYADEGQQERVTAETERLRRKYPGFEIPEDVFLPKVARGTDESQLWKLYEKDDFTGIDAEMIRRKTETPDWEPTADFAGKLARKKQRVLMMEAAGEKNWTGVINAGAGIDPTRETEIDLLWTLIDAYAATGMKKPLADTYRGILLREPKLPDTVLVTTLQKAVRDFPAVEVKTVIDRLAITPALQIALQPVSFDLLRKTIADFNADAGQTKPLSDAVITPLEDAAEQTPRNEDMALLGWYYLKIKQPAAAADWFQKALDDKADAENAKGLYLSLAAQNLEEEAYKVAADHLQDLSGDPEFLMNALSLRFAKPDSAAIDEKIVASYSTTILQTLNADHAEILAWYAYNSKQYEASAAWFQKSLDWKPAAARVKGLALSYLRLADKKDYAALEEKYAAAYPDIWAGIKTASPPKGRQAADVTRPRAIIQANYLRNFQAKRYGDCVADIMNLRARGQLSTDAALIGGWCYLSLDRLSEARATFAIALKSGGKAEADAAYGTALTLLRAKLTDDAEAILNTYAMTPSRDREIRAEIYVQRARAAFDSKQYQKTLDALNARASLIAEPADLSQLRGWAYYHLGNRGVANQVFRRLSEHMADAGVARGLAVTSDMGGRQ
ncbi:MULTISPECIES: hypothetical protein [unclassified Rhizobium]|uniref:hypothetical protein n=1 Tax=unclassified Rhizobium TaxID=2613769 RepID=UPI0006F50274|nr:MULTISPECIES: hypothetical protein [unclassified Rhizobium]KQV43834.1 hypothetical protein ASC86_03275 [Rhizobium sp. Root1212]KRD38017.1 hypothetical protein ASE37_03275 [Rhizobium sp. Root268]